MGRKSLTVLLLVFSVFLINFVSAYEPHQINLNYTYSETVPNADSCNLTSITYPTADPANLGIEMTKNGFEFSALILSGNFSEKGDTCWYIICYDSDADPQYVGDKKCLSVDDDGKASSEGAAIFQAILALILFGVSCFWLLLSFKINEIGPKIFFMVLSFIFIMATMMGLYQTSVEFNISDSISETTGAMVFIVGIVLAIIFLYILIRQTVVILDMYKVNKGLKMSGRSVTGYGSNNWMYN